MAKIQGTIAFRIHDTILHLYFNRLNDLFLGFAAGSDYIPPYFLYRSNPSLQYEQSRSTASPAHISACIRGGHRAQHPPALRWKISECKKSVPASCNTQMSSSNTNRTPHPRLWSQIQESLWKSNLNNSKTHNPRSSSLSRVSSRKSASNNHKTPHPRSSSLSRVSSQMPNLNNVETYFSRLSSQTRESSRMPNSNNHKTPNPRSTLRSRVSSRMPNSNNFETHFSRLSSLSRVSSRKSASNNHSICNQLLLNSL